MRTVTWRVYDIRTRKVIFRTPSHKKAVAKLAELGQGYDLACHWYSI